VFNGVYRLEIQSVMLVFSTQLCEFLTFSLVHASPPPPATHPCVKEQFYRQTVCGWEGVGVWVLSPVGDHILHDFNTLHLTRFKIYKIARPPQTKS
jgi:hypothetical protein